jgi:uracil phosphoribosyltransferase
MQAEREDNQGNRIRRVRQMLFEQFGVSAEDDHQQQYDFTWKNTSRSCTVLFKNIRELPDASFENNDEDWKLVIDFPFDELGHGPKDDISRLQQFKTVNPLGAKTICWIPQFFSADALKDLGTLVILEHILTGERFGQYSNHLSPQDRQAAKSLLENQRSVLRTRVQNHLDAAYGLDAITHGSLDTTHELEQHEQFFSLDDRFDPQPPVAANLGGAMNHLLSQALMSEFPGAPNFEAEIKIGNLRKVQAVLSEAAQSQDGRVAVEKTIRSLVRYIANPLQLGEMGHDATHFVLGHHWRNHFNKKAAEASSTISVGQLRKWIDQPRAMGLPKEAQNMVILTYAEQTNRTFILHNAPVEVSLTSLADNYVLQEQKLPDEAHWNVAVSRAAQIFGEAVSPLMKATTVANLSAALKKKSSEVRSSCVSLQEKLKERLSKLGVDPANSPRLTTASATASLVEKLHVSEASQVVSALASAAVATTEAAMGECLGKASQLLATIESTNWEIFDAIAKLADERQAVAQSIRSSIARALQSDEHVTSLGPTLKEAQHKAVRLLTQTPQTAPPVVPPVVPPVTGVTSVTLPGVTTPPVTKPTTTKKILESETRSDLSISELKKIVTDLEMKYTGKQVIKFNASWIVEE